MKELKDFIHLYLGAKVRYTYYDYEENTWTVWEQLTTNVLNKITTDWSIKDIQIQLRKLSDMTDEELKSLRSERGNLKGVERADMNYIIRLTTWSPEDVRYLLSRHFDLFGLIESGLAIDSKTLKEKI
jgi:hypothetical protein